MILGKGVPDLHPTRTEGCLWEQANLPAIVSVNKCATEAHMAVQYNDSLDLILV